MEIRICRIRFCLLCWQSQSYSRFSWTCRPLNRSSFFGLPGCSRFKKTQFLWTWDLQLRILHISLCLNNWCSSIGDKSLIWGGREGCPFSRFRSHSKYIFVAQYWVLSGTTKPGAERYLSDASLVNSYLFVSSSKTYHTSPLLAHTHQLYGTYSCPCLSTCLLCSIFVCLKQCD